MGVRRHSCGARRLRCRSADCWRWPAALSTQQASPPSANRSLPLRLVMAFKDSITHATRGAHLHNLVLLGRYQPLPLGEGGRVLIFVCEVVLLGVGDKRLLVCKFPLRHRLSPTPVFLGFPFHRWRGGVLALDPVRRAPTLRLMQISHQLKRDDAQHPSLIGNGRTLKDSATSIFDDIAWACADLRRP